MSVSLITGSGTVRAPLKERGDDLYETPVCAVRALLAVEPIPLCVWEPACGPGAIVRVLRDSGRAVIATDLVDWKCPDAKSGIDFLMEREAIAGVPAIVTNPPFKLAEEFLEKALDLVPEVYFLLRLAFLEGMRWQKRGFADHLARVWVFAPRLPMMHRHKFEIGYALAVFAFMLSVCVAAILIDAHQRTGWSGVVVWSVILSAMPVGMTGLWLRVRK